MARYRTKPTIIETEQFTQAHVEAHLFDGKPLPRGVHLGNAKFNKEERTVTWANFYVETILDRHAPIVVGDWIIPEPNGLRFKPCNAVTFAATYEEFPPGQEDGPFSWPREATR